LRVQHKEMPIKGAGILIPLVLTLALPLRAQDSYPKVEVFGGYSFSHYSLFSAGHNLNGWGASFSGSMTKYLGVTADFSGAYGSEPYISGCVAPPEVPFPPGCAVQVQDLSAYHFLFGPRFTLRRHGVTPFAQALFGVANIRQEKDGNHSNFAMGFGGGVDVPLGKHLAYRLFQANYIPTKRPYGVGGWDSDFRVETGIVFTFGKK
jgi:hypothetical protein